MTELRQRMLEELQIRQYSPRTQKIYISNVARFAKHFNKSPADLTAAEVRAYHVHLVTEKKASPATVRSVISALRFLYQKVLQRTDDLPRLPYGRREQKLPVILSQGEITRLFEVTTNRKHRAILMAAYAGGLRVSEVCRLRIEDIDSQRMVLNVRQGKGKKDRTVMLAQSLLEELREYWRAYRPRTRWLFAGDSPDRHIRVRSAQRVFKKALRKAGIRKRASIHSLRHSFATHLTKRVRTCGSSRC